MSKMVRMILCVAALAALAGCSQPPAPANTGPESARTPAATVVSLTVVDAWTRATPQGATAAGGYLTINNPTARPDRLVSVSSPRSPRVELHNMTSANGVMEMRAVQGIDIPASDSVTLAPGGLHIMFLELPAAFAAGETVPVVLTFAQAGDVNAVLEVRAPDALAAPVDQQPSEATADQAAPAGEAAAHGAGEPHNH